MDGVCEKDAYLTMSMRKAKQFLVALAAFWVVGFIDTLLYTYHAIDNGHYFVAPFDFIIEYHSHGIGLVTLIAWLASLFGLVVMWLRMR